MVPTEDWHSVVQGASRVEQALVAHQQIRVPSQSEVVLEAHTVHEDVVVSTMTVTWALAVQAVASRVV